MKQVPAPYLNLPLCLLRRTDVGPKAKLIWAYLRHCESDGAPAFPKQRTIALALGLSVKAVRLGIRRLERARPPLVTVNRRGNVGGRPNAYVTLLAEGPALNGAPPLSKRGATPYPKGAQPPAQIDRTLRKDVRNELRPEKERDLSLPLQAHGSEDSTTARHQAADAETRLLAIAFPHGATPKQARCLLNAVAFALRRGMTRPYLAHALLGAEPAVPPWVTVEECARQGRDLLNQVGESAGCFIASFEDLSRLAGRTPELYRLASSRHFSSHLRKAYHWPGEEPPCPRR